MVQRDWTLAETKPLVEADIAALRIQASTVTALSASNALKAPLLNPTFQGVVSLPAGSTLNGVPLTSGGGGGGGGGTPSIVVNSVAFPSGDVQLRFNFSAGLPTTEWTWQLNIVDELDRTPSAVRFVCVAKTATSLTVKGIPAYSFADGITERSCYFFLQVWQASSPFDQLVRFAGMAWRSEGGSQVVLISNHTRREVNSFGMALSVPVCARAPPVAASH